MTHEHRQVRRNLSRPADVLLTALACEPGDAVTLHAWGEHATNTTLEPAAFHRMLASLEKHGQVEGEQTDGPLRRYALTPRGRLELEQMGSHEQRQRFLEERNAQRHRRKDRSMQFMRWMLRLYPRGWRERYEVEMIALLEQHTITLWTTIDLLFGALDARLDPHYRRVRPFMPWQGLARSWNLLLTAMIAFWLILVFNRFGGAVWPPFYWQALHAGFGFLWNPSDPTTIFAWIAYFTQPVLFTALIGWIGWQGSKRARNLLHLVPVGVFFLFFFCRPLVGASFNVALYVAGLVSLVLNAHTLASMCTSFKRWEKVTSLWLAWGARFCALLFIAGMAFISVTQWGDFLSSWDALRAIQSIPLLPGFLFWFFFYFFGFGINYGMPVLTTLLALYALVRSFFALKATRRTLSPRAVPRQEPLSFVSVSLNGMEQEQERTGEQAGQPSLADHQSTAFSQQGKVGAKVWLTIALLLAFAFIALLVVAAHINLKAALNPLPPLLVSSMMLLILASCLTAIPIAIIVQKARRKGIFHQEQEVLLQQVQVMRQPS